MKYILPVFLYLFSGGMALAQEDTEKTEEKKEKSSFIQGFSNNETRIRLMGVGEAWKDPSVIQVYRGSRFFGVLGFSYRLHTNLAIELESGYTRINGNNGLSHLQLYKIYHHLLLNNL